MKRIAFLVALLILLFLGLVIANLLSPARIAILNVELKQDVFYMFLFGVGAVGLLAIYDVFAAFGSFRRQREQQKTIERLETELLESKHKPPPPATY
ncbi:MAG: hypothetical protein A3G34_11085 [Candidatus Lindowbacteria bacterium RIFCSPLOWO2_12_FULL_62_27]|nr:MAG: hypothetical protein A3G34_11085 [Candidatus Lindowbacteria bacterium RIFCSPLOWO2_12_FULL_62_27]OGH63440.1 MAG: hypothetical protein A3I06_06645 [Candidatus Lindowbacteria bacterium RIFCSPLOWO2_02_FULL_62_12]